MEALAAKAEKNIRNTVRDAIKLDPAKKAVVIFDTKAPLARIVADAYRAAVPEATFIDFDTVAQADVLAAMTALTAGDLVVLVQSASFRLNEFRIRIELFQRGLATIEHIHLERITDPAQMEAYVDALAYDPAYYPPLGAAIKARIDRAGTITVRCAGTTLTYEGGMEPAKLNVGDYSAMKNVGGTFPIGEVFSEPKHLENVNGEAMLFGFAGLGHLVQLHQPFKVRIEKGMLTAPDAPAEFRAILDMIGAQEDILVREFGIGLNPAMGKHRLVSDITAFERQKGLHLSLGEKHGIYKKPGFNPKKTRYHIDVFVDIETIDIDGAPFYKDGEFIL